MLRCVLAFFVLVTASAARTEGAGSDTGVAPKETPPVLILRRSTDRPAAKRSTAYLDGFELEDGDYSRPLAVPDRVSLVVRAVDERGEPLLDDWVEPIDVKENVDRSVPIVTTHYVRGEWMIPMIISSLCGLALIGVAADRQAQASAELDPTPFYAVGGSLVGASLALAVPTFLPELGWHREVPR